MASRQAKLNSLFKKLASDFFKGQRYGQTLISITECEVGGNLRQAKLKISIYPEEKEEEVLKYIKSEARELRAFVGSKTKMRILPYFNFEIDLGEKNRQKIEKISNSLKK